MVQRHYVEISDDIDGSTEGVTTHTFSLDGAGYEIDLSAENGERLYESLAEFVGHARVTAKPRKTRRLTSVSTPEPPSPRAVREWALAQGIEISTRGRVPVAIIEQYLAS